MPLFRTRSSYDTDSSETRRVLPLFPALKAPGYYHTPLRGESSGGPYRSAGSAAPAKIRKNTEF
jgi:hypothetical protein